MGVWCLGPPSRVKDKWRSPSVLALCQDDPVEASWLRPSLLRAVCLNMFNLCLPMGPMQPPPTSVGTTALECLMRVERGLATERRLGQMAHHYLSLLITGSPGSDWLLRSALSGAPGPPSLPEGKTACLSFGLPLSHRHFWLCEAPGVLD